MYTLFTVLSAIALVAAAPAPPMPVPDAAGMPVHMSMGLQNPGAPGCGCYNGNWQGPYYSSCQPKAGSPEYLGKLNTHSNSLTIGPDADYVCPYKYPYGCCDPCYGSDKFKGGYPCGGCAPYYGSENYICPGSRSIGGIDYGCCNFNDFNGLNNGWSTGVDVEIDV